MDQHVVKTDISISQKRARHVVIKYLIHIKVFRCTYHVSFIQVVQIQIMICQKCKIQVF